MQKNLKVIKTLRDVYEVASRMFPCGAKKIDEISGKGYMGVKLIVGEKMNPIYDMGANPDKPGLNPEQRNLEAQKAKLAVPDIRILWIAPGTTVQDLVRDYLQGIKDDLEKKEPIIDVKTTRITTKEVSDADIAAQVARGENPNTEFEADEETEIGFGSSEPEQEIGQIGKAIKEDLEDEEPSANSQIIEAIGTIGKNMETLAGSIESISERLEKVEKDRSKGKSKK